MQKTLRGRLPNEFQKMASDTKSYLESVHKGSFEIITLSVHRADFSVADVEHSDRESEKRNSSMQKIFHLSLENFSFSEISTNFYQESQRNPYATQIIIIITIFFLAFVFSTLFIRRDVGWELCIITSPYVLSATRQRFNYR